MSQFNRGQVSSNSNDWETPQALFDYWSRIFSFTVDGAAEAHNAKCERFWSPSDDAFNHDWANERVWLNPPYGRGIGDWVKKAKYEAQNHGALVVCLLKNASETKWWDLIDGPHTTIRRIKGRVQFSNCGVNAPFPSVIVIFWPQVGA